MAWILLREWRRRGSEVRRIGEAADGLAGGQGFQKFACGFVERGMACLGRYFGEGRENEAALMHGGMGNLEAGFIDRMIAKEHDIDIDFARTFLRHAKTTHFRFELQGELEQVARRFVSFDGGDAVEEPGLIGNVDRLGLIKRRDREQAAGGF
jgi:hypothetical protein